MTQNTVDNNKKAFKYLQLFRAKGIINLISICPKNKRLPIGITRDSKSPDLLDFITKHNGVNNLYYMVNEPYKKSPDKKLEKKDVEKIHALYIDPDPEKDKDFNEERKRISKLSESLNKDKDFQPSFIIDSGGGHQAFWLLDKPLDNSNISLVEDYCRGLETKYKTDRVHNIDRIMRLPFTWNIPTEKKTKLGRKKSLSKVIYASQKKYQWDKLKNICEPEKKDEYEKVDLSNSFPLLNNETSWKDHPILEQKFYEALNNDNKLKALMMNTIKKPSRSECDFLLAQQLKMAGWSLEDTAIALWLFPHGKGKELNAREINRTYQRANNPIEGMALPNAKEIMAQKNPLLPEIDDKGNILPKRLKLTHSSALTWNKSGLPLIKNLIDQNSLVVTYGQSNVGKSFLVLDQAMHLALGKDWGEYKVPNKVAVIYVFAEAGGSAGKRLKAARIRCNVPDNANEKDFPFYSVTMDINMLEKPSKNRDDVNDLIILAKTVEKNTGYKVGQVVIDTLSTTFSGGNENSSEDMGTYITNSKLIQNGINCCVHIVHHSGKDQAAGARGHSSLRAATDTEFEVKSELQGTRYHRELIVKKQRDGETGIKIKFGLNVVELGKDVDSDPITSCNVVLEGDSEFANIIPNAVDSLNNEHKRMYYAIYLANKTSNGHQSLVNAWLDYLIKDNTPLEQSNIDILVRTKPITNGIKNDDVDAKRQNINNWRNSLVNKNIVECKAISTKPGDVIWSII